MTEDSWATASVLVEALAAAGVRDAVLCPGSRSAPLAYALADADSRGEVRLHVRVDERSAGFLALGLAKGSGLPVPVVTTSGTAVAELHPAVLEAHHAGVPVLVVSADRPAGVRGLGGNQTTVQPGMFAAAVRAEWDLQESDDVASVAACACSAALGLGGDDPGPVHVNLPLAEPLVPPSRLSPPRVRESSHLPPSRIRVSTHRTRWQPTRDVEGAAPPAPVLPAEGRTLVLLGDVPDPHAAADAVALAATAGWPVVAEPFGAFDRAGVIPSSVLLATDWVDAHLPERLLVCGRITLSRGATRLLRAVPVVDSVFALRRWPDQSGRARATYPWASLGASLEAVRGAGDPAYLASWRAAGEVADGIGHEWGSGEALVRAVLDATGADVFTGPSNIVRDLDLAGVRDGRTVWASRGLAGIDGCVSTAVGIGLATGEPLVALLGDLTLLHDTNGLLIGPGEPRPDVTFVVLDDAGGGIFATLEHGAVASEGEREAARFERVFGTATGADVEAICRAHGVGYVRAGSADDVRAALREVAGLRVVHVPMSRARRREQRAALAATLAARLSPRR